MGTDYDPPTRTEGIEEYTMSDDTFKLIQNELKGSNIRSMQDLIMGT